MLGLVAVSQTERWHQMRWPQRLLYGTVAVTFLGLPLWIGLLAYGIALLCNSPAPGTWGKTAGFLVLFMSGVMLLGNALAVSARPRAPSPPEPLAQWDASVQMADAIEVWKAAVEVQKHFNDLELRIRNYAVTLL